MGGALASKAPWPRKRPGLESRVSSGLQRLTAMESKKANQASIAAAATKSGSRFGRVASLVSAPFFNAPADPAWEDRAWEDRDEEASAGDRDGDRDGRDLRTADRLERAMMHVGVRG